MLLDINLELILDNYINTHINSNSYLFSLFDDDPEAMLNDPMGSYVIAKLPQTNLIPGSTIKDSELTQWYHQQLLLAYNHAYGTNFNYQQVRSLLAIR
jgi:hypothetical protein